MFHLNPATVLLIHEDRVKDAQKMYEPFLLFRRGKFWRKSKQAQDASPCNSLREIPQGR